MGILRTNTVSGIETPTPVTGSVVFDGSGDYLTSSYSNTNFDWWTASFTVEAWVYASSWSGWSISTIPLVVGNMEPTASTNYWSFGPISTGALKFYYFNGGGVNITSTATLSTGQWNHIAVTQSSSNIRLFINGVLDTSTTISGTPQSSSGVSLTIGQFNSTCINGYVSNLRILKGTALYTSNFTPPTRELQPIGDTVLLCCNNPDSAGAEATGKTIAVNGNAAASTFSPGLVRNFTFGTQFDGVSKFDTQGYFVPPSGTTEQRSRGRGVFGGGFPNTNAIDYINIQSTGNAIDFGDLSQARNGMASCSSSTRGLWGGGNTPTVVNTIDYVTISTTSNAQDFGDLTVVREAFSACSSSTRGLFGGGLNPTVQNTIDYITIASIGNAIDFGDLTLSRYNNGSCSSNTRGIFAGGGSPVSNTIDYVTIASIGNAIDFGDLTIAREQCGSCSSNIRGIFGGGTPGPTSSNVIDYITIASIGNAIDFGDLTVARRALTSNACSSGIRGVFGGGYVGGVLNIIDYVTIAATGNAQDFGDLTVAKSSLGACSDSHGGLS